MAEMYLLKLMLLYIIYALLQCSIGLKRGRALQDLGRLKHFQDQVRFLYIFDLTVIAFTSIFVLLTLFHYMLGIEY